MKNNLSLTLSAILTGILFIAAPCAVHAESRPFCMSHFDLSKDLQKSHRVIEHKSHKSWIKLLNMVSEYAMCQSLVEKTPNSCSALSIYGEDLTKACYDNFYYLILFKDLERKTTANGLDSIDFESCARQTKLDATSQANKDYCNEVASEFLNRRNACGAMKYLVPPDELDSAIRQCRANLYNFSPSHPGDMSDVTTGTASYLWRKIKPNCAASPFDSALTRGACLGIFYGESSCKNLLGRIKTTYCSAVGAY